MKLTLKRPDAQSADVRRALGLGAAAIALLAVTACSGSESTGNSEKVDVGGQLVAQMPAAKGDVDNIVWNLTDGEPDSLDPRMAATYSGGQVVNNLCEPLVTNDAEYNLTPNLAEFEQVSPTELRYTLIADAEFWDGTPVTAEDVAYSLNRAAEPSSFVNFIYANVKSIEATGDREVTVRFSKPDEMFNNEMTTIAGLIVEKDFTEKAADKVGTPGGGLMCSGPFELTSWTSGDSIELTRNDTYWNPDRRPFAASVKFTFVTDTTAVTQALESGEIDGAYELAASSLGSLADSSVGNLVFGPSTQSVHFDVAGPDGPLADLKLREALGLVVDREGIAEKIYNGAASPLYTSVTPTTWPSDESDLYQAAYDKFESARTYDVEKAKSLVEESDYSGQEIVLATVAGDETQGRVAQLLQQDAKQAGINIKIQTLQPLVMAQAGYDAAKRKGLDLMFSESFNGVQDPLEPTGFMFLPGAFYNYTNFSDPTVTANLVQARQSFDGAERARLFLAAQEIYEAANATIPVVSTNTATFLSKDLTGAITSFAYWAMPQMAYVGSTKD
ncbi:MAG: ABC transporter substrate-binding protein [Nocardioides sp.]|uniref:ABC transporter substrate-binding protein n=1 Tax=Nocardioides sp. TaxID=35761 RepID=UPI003267D177